MQFIYPKENIELHNPDTKLYVFMLSSNPLSLQKMIKTFINPFLFKLIATHSTTCIRSLTYIATSKIVSKVGIKAIAYPIPIITIETILSQSDG